MKIPNKRPIFKKGDYVNIISYLILDMNLNEAPKRVTNGKIIQTHYFIQTNKIQFVYDIKLINNTIKRGVKELDVELDTFRQKLNMI
jgi:hypothetical protein